MIDSRLQVQEAEREKIVIEETEIDEELADRIKKMNLKNREEFEAALKAQGIPMAAVRKRVADEFLIVPETGPEDAAWENARIRADLLRTELQQGGNFAELAKQYSRDASARDGGDLGTLKRGELAQDIETQILSLSPGQISVPYRSALGYHVFRLESKETLEGEGLGRVKAQIREILFREKFDTRLDAWLKEIKQRAVIDVRLDGQL